MNRILIVSPFRNESLSIPYYLESLSKLSYPHNLIDVYMLEQDSSDNTVELLQRGKERLQSFNSVELEGITILGKVPKQESGGYWKDIKYGDGRVDTWLRIWNDYFFPKIKSSNTDFILTWFADCVAPSNIIEEYMRVYEEKNDAGWVGGVMYRRHPREKELISPWQKFWKKGIPKDITRVPFAASHCWLGQRKILQDMKMAYDKYDFHFSIIAQLKAKGKYCYCQPSVFLKHVSTDGKIYQ